MKLGRSGDTDWEVLDGLKEGERVVIHGNLLIDGQAQLNRLANPSSTLPTVFRAYQTLTIFPLHCDVALTNLA